MVKFGISLPNCGEGLIYPPPFANHNDLVNLAKEAEELGYFSIWLNDHVTTQDYVRNAFSKAPNYYEPLITLAYIAAQTSKCRLATGVLVLPLREPVLLAKQVAVLDLLSGGRMLLGVGLGAYKEEFERMFPKIPTKYRPVILDECIQALRILWTHDIASFHGKYITFKDIQPYPKPVQKTVPLYMGGNSEQSLKRVAKWGDGWFPAMQSPTEVAATRAKIRQYCTEFGRSDSQIDISPELTISMANSKEMAMRRFYDSFLFQHMRSLRNSTLKNLEDRFEGRMLVGTSDDVIELIQKYVDAGVTHFGSLIFPAQTIAEFASAMREFAKCVMPSFG